MIDESLINQIVDEAKSADVRYGEFASTHEAFGVLAEEMAELLDAIRANALMDVGREAVQVSAVAFRLASHCVTGSHFHQRSTK